MSFGSGLADHPATDIARARLDRLLSHAFSEFGSRCLWNVRYPSEGEDMSLMVCQLKRYGDLRAWDLAVEIARAAEGASDGLE